MLRVLLLAFFWLGLGADARARPADHLNDVAHGYVISACFDHLYLNNLGGKPRAWQRIVVPALFTAVAAVGLNSRSWEKGFQARRYCVVVGAGLARAFFVYQWR